MREELRNILTPDEAKRVVAEMRAFHVEQDYANLEAYEVIFMEQLYELTEECYLVRYRSGVHTVWAREEDGILRPTASFTLIAPDFLHPSQKLEQAE